MSATSTNTLGFILWTVAIAVVGWMAAVASEWWQLRRENNKHPLKEAAIGSLRAGIFMASGLVTLVAVAFGISLIHTVYEDHQNLVATVNSLNGQLSPQCWMENLGMKPPAYLGNGMKSGNIVVFWCNTDREAPLSIEWDFKTPPKRIGAPMFPDMLAIQGNTFFQGSMAETYIDFPSLSKNQPTAIEIFGSEKLAPQANKIIIRTVSKTSVPKETIIKPNSIR